MTLDKSDGFYAAFSTSDFYAQVSRPEWTCPSIIVRFEKKSFASLGEFLHRIAIMEGQVR